MTKALTYKSSGVDISKANAFVRSIGGAVQSTLSRNVLKKKGAFAALYALGTEDLLVSSTDGVGTKLLIAQAFNKHSTVGIDLVAMNVNDILCVGAKPLFFLDYIACGRLNPGVLNRVVQGIAAGCRISGCSLVGGETAEMPDMYKPNEYDLAGFAVGMVKRKDLVDGSRIRAGDVAIGLPSSGIHSNGYSLVRKALKSSGMKAWQNELLKPTRIYVPDVLPVLEKFPVKGMAHITGGAYYEKLTKILPRGTCFSLNTNAWPVPKIFQFLQKKGKISKSEMYRTFNMGIGFVIVVSPRDVSAVTAYLKRKGTKHYIMGEVVNHKTKKVIL